MSISFRQRRTAFVLAANTPTQLLIEGDEGTFTNGCDSISVQITNTGAAALDTVRVYVDSGGYGNDYVLNSDATAQIGLVGVGGVTFVQLIPTGWLRFKFVGTSVVGTTVTFTVVGNNAG